MNKYLILVLCTLVCDLANAQKKSLLIAHVALNGDNKTYLSGDSTTYYYSGLREHGSLYHPEVRYDSSVKYWVNSVTNKYEPFKSFKKGYDTFHNVVELIGRLKVPYYSTERDSNVYDSCNRIIFSRRTYKASPTDSFVNTSEGVFFYNPDSTLSHSIGHWWSGSAFTPSNIDTYQYVNKLPAERIMKYMQSGVMTNHLRVSKTFTGNNVKEIVVYHWTISGWYPGVKNVYNYNSKDLVVEDSAVYNSIDSFFYDANDKLTLKAHWSLSGGLYYKTRLDTFMYDTLNRLTCHLQGTKPNGIWHYGSGACGDKYYYNDTIKTTNPTNIETIDISHNIRVFPNPVINGTVNYDFDLPVSTRLHWQIVDIDGRILRSWHTDKQFIKGRIDLTDTAPGLYHIIVTGDKYLGSKQIIVIK